jgi:hypothetical protein
MRDEDFEMFCKLMNLSAQVTIGETKTDEELGFYFELLSDLNYSDVAKAIRTHMNTCSFFPKPADIRNIISPPASKELKNVKGEVEFNKVLRLVQKYGRYSSMEFDDPKLTYAIQSAGGWIALCESTEYTLPAIKRSFIAAYQEAATMNYFPAEKKLPGLSDHVVRIGIDGERTDFVLPKKNERKALEDKQLKQMTAEQREEYSEKFKKLMSNFSLNKKQEKNFSLEVEE